MSASRTKRALLSRLSRFQNELPRLNPTAAQVRAYHACDAIRERAMAVSDTPAQLEPLWNHLADLMLEPLSHPPIEIRDPAPGLILTPRRKDPL